jgi:hypothetical protein
MVVESFNSSTFYKNLPFKPFTGNFDVPKQKCLNELFWFFLDKVRHYLTKFSTLVTSQKKGIFALSDASKCVFEKCCYTNFAK